MDEAEHFAIAQRQIDASNRTTHAVRALTTFIVYEAAYGLATIILLAIAFIPTLSLREPWWLLVVAAVLIGVAGLIHSFKTAFAELSKSEVPVARNTTGVIRLNNSSRAPNPATPSGSQSGNVQVVAGKCGCEVATRHSSGVWKVGDSYICKNCNRRVSAASGRRVADNQ